MLEMHKKERRIPRLIFTGFSMGLADLVPGVSGGTIALLYGIYDELLYSIRVVTGKVPKLILRGKIKQTIGIIPFAFLVPLMLGLLTAIFGMVEVVTYLLDVHPAPVWSLFFGLVLGSAYVVSKRVVGWNRARVGLAIFGFVVTFIVVGLPVLSLSTSPIVLFVTGAIASCAMILPGISGSLLMVIMGQYENVLHAVADRQFDLLVVFALGAITGLALFARLLSWLLRTHHSATIALLIGVLLGSLRKVWPWQTESANGSTSIVLPEPSVAVLGAVVLMLVGFAVVWYLEKLGIAREHLDISANEFKKEVNTQHD